MAFKNRIFIILTFVGLALIIQCGFDKEDIQAFKVFLASRKNQAHVEKFVRSQNFLKYGYQNVVDSTQIDTLKILTKNYHNFLDSFEPQYRSTRKMKENYLQPVVLFQKDLLKLEERIRVYRDLTAHIDSLSADSQKVDLGMFEQKRNVILESITSKFLIERTIFFINQITAQIKALEINPQGGIKNGKQN